MKKFLLTIILSTSFVFKGEAQVLIGDTTGDAIANLEIKSTGNVAKGILIPRVTVAYLDANASLYKIDQDGTLIFVTDGPGTTGTTTSLITGSGFYYFDANQSKWININSANYGNGSFIPINLTIPLTSGATWDGWASIDYTNNNYFQFIGTSTSGYSINLPNPSLFTNRTIYIRNNTYSTITYSNAATWFETTSIEDFGFTQIPNTATHQFYSDGSRWYLMGGAGSTN